MTSPYLTRQRERWTRPNAHLFVRPDWRRFVPRDQDHHPFALYEGKYRPDQPRVPAGSREGGQWTTDGAGGGSRSPGSQAATKPPPINDPRVISDAVLDNDWKPGAQYAANNSRRPPAGSPRGGPETPAQSARLAIVEARAREAIAQVRELDPKWQPRPSVYETVEGRIAAAQAEAHEARARLLELSHQGIGPGPYAGESIPARGPGRNHNLSEIEKNNENGFKYGCHTCGTFDPNTRSGSFILDHQHPSALNSRNQQRIYPQCATCSARQGGFVSQLKRRR